MATRNFNANKSSLFAKTGSTELGGGQDDHLPVGGSWNGYTFRSAVRFATDWSGMKNIQSAILYLKTSSAVHLAFSSDPDIYIARATADWTANSASSSTEGGSGWSTAATNYPGPAITTSGQVSKDVSPSEGTWITVDISTIVRAWAPASVVGGGGAANYGVLLYGVASGDLTEFNSYTSTTKPYIVVTYTTDSPPTATMDGPTGVQATTRPTLTGHASDPDGDAITYYHVQVLQGATVVYDAPSVAPDGAGNLVHVPTTDLPGGALTAHCGAAAGGLTSPWSNDVSFTVDRPPVIGAFSAPVGAGSNRRPVMTWTYTDPDGNTADAYHLQVYATAGGVATGAPVYEYAPGGSFPSPISHTPTADLPGGPLVVRASVRSGPAGLWSGWSVDQPFTIALTTPTTAWIWPATDGGYVPDAQLQDLTVPVDQLTYIIGQVESRPPSGQTLTRGVWEMMYANGGWFPIYDGPVEGIGGIFTTFQKAEPNSLRPYGHGRVRWTVYASGGGSLVSERGWRASSLEWLGSVFLGDQVSGLSTALADIGGGHTLGWIRAQSAASPTAVGLPWRLGSEAATVVGELPSTGAWLGLRARYNHRAPDAQICFNGSFESTPNALDGWRNSSTSGGRLYVQPEAGAPGGATGMVAVLAGASSGWVTAVNDAMVGNMLVVPGRVYTLSAWHRAEGAFPSHHLIRLHMYTPVGAYVGASWIQLLWPAGSALSVWTYKYAAWECPPGVGMVALEMALQGTPPENEYSVWDAISLTGPAGGAAPGPAAGLDKWTVNWTSLG